MNATHTYLHIYVYICMYVIRGKVRPNMSTASTKFDGRYLAVLSPAPAKKRNLDQRSEASKNSYTKLVGAQRESLPSMRKTVQESQRETETDRDRERRRETERDRDRQRETETDRDRQREREVGTLGLVSVTSRSPGPPAAARRTIVGERPSFLLSRKKRRRI